MIFYLKALALIISLKLKKRPYDDQILFFRSKTVDKKKKIFVSVGIIHYFVDNIYAWIYHEITQLVHRTFFGGETEKKTEFAKRYGFPKTKH